MSYNKKEINSKKIARPSAKAKLDPFSKDVKFDIHGIDQWDPNQYGLPIGMTGDSVATYGYGNMPLYIEPNVGPGFVAHPNTGTIPLPEGATSFREYPMAQYGGDPSIPEINHEGYIPKGEQGGWLDTYQGGGPMSSQDSLRHQAGKTMDFEFRKGSANGKGLSNYGYNAYTGPGIPTKEQAIDYYMETIAPKLGNFKTAMEKGEAGDFMYNTGKDVRPYAYQEYLRRTDPQNKTGWMDADKKWKYRNNPPANFDSLYNSTIGSLPEDGSDYAHSRRKSVNAGRDWYYQNTAPKGSTWDLKTQGPHPAYENSWKDRVNEAVNTFQDGGELDAYQVGGNTYQDLYGTPQFNPNGPNRNQLQNVPDYLKGKVPYKRDLTQKEISQRRVDEYPHTYNVQDYKKGVSEPAIQESISPIDFLPVTGAMNLAAKIGPRALKLAKGIRNIDRVDDAVGTYDLAKKFVKSNPTNTIEDLARNVNNINMGNPLGTIDDIKRLKGKTEGMWRSEGFDEITPDQMRLYNMGIKSDDFITPRKSPGFNINAQDDLINRIHGEDLNTNRLMSGYSDIPQFNQQVETLKQYGQIGKQPMITKNDVYNNKEFENWINQYSDYHKKLNEFENARFKSGEHDMMNMMFNPQKLRDDFENLYPNTRLPVNKLPIGLNSEEFSVYNNMIPNSRYLTHPSSITKEGLTSNAQNLLKMQNKEDWFYKADPRDYLTEMRGNTGLTPSQIKNMSDEEVMKMSQKIYNNKYKQLIQRYQNELNNKFPAIDAYQQLSPNKHGGSVKKKLRVQNLPTSNQNIQSNINELQMQNKDLFGPVGKRRFLPTKEDGGWLDNY